MKHRLITLVLLLQCLILRAAGDNYDFLYRPGGDKGFSEYFFDTYLGLANYGQDFWTGFNCVWMTEDRGPYVSVGTDFVGGWSVFSGAAVRLTDESEYSIDWQLYAGIGSVCGRFGFNVGTRLGWETDTIFSKWDVGVGFQVYEHNVSPTLTLGLYIWGIPTVVTIGLVCCAFAGL